MKQLRITVAHGCATLTIFLLAAPLACAQRSPADFQEITYKTTDSGPLVLHLYPNSANKSLARTPVVLYTHGGGWAAGSHRIRAQANMRLVVQGLQQAGYCVASVEYRLAKEGSSITIRDCVIDCKDAARYLAKHAEELSLDPNHFCSFGDSAGGQLAQMLLLSPPESLPGDPQLADANYHFVAGVSWYGPCDFEKTELFHHPDGTSVRDRFAGRILGNDSSGEEKLARYREVSPITYLNANSPPLLMIQGDQDTTIPVHHAHYMKQQAKTLGAPVETVIVKNSGHNWKRVGGTEIKPTRDEIVELTLSFLTKHRDG